MSDNKVPCVPDYEEYKDHQRHVDRIRNEIEEIAVFEREVNQRTTVKKN